MDHALTLVYGRLLDAGYAEQLFAGVLEETLTSGSRRGRCPFHPGEESTLLIFADRPEYFCYACGARGDWVDYLQKQGGMSHAEAVQFLAGAAACPVPAVSRESWAGWLARIPVLEALDAHLQALLWSSDGETTRTWFAERGYDVPEIEGMGLGCWPGTAAVDDFLSSQGLAAAGLMQTEQPLVTFACRSACGSLRGFVGREINGDGYHELVPHTFDEHSPLLLHRVRGRRQLVVVQGLLDAFLASHSGVDGVVGVGNEGLTAEQLDTACFFGAREFLLAFKQGSTGQEALRRTLILLRERGLTGRVLLLPELCHDVDELLRNTCRCKVPEYWKNLVEGSVWLEENAFL